MAIKDNENVPTSSTAGHCSDAAKEAKSSVEPPTPTPIAEVGDDLAMITYGVFSAGVSRRYLKEEGKDLPSELAIQLSSYPRNQCRDRQEIW